MRGLAEYIMRGRTQAVIVAVMGAGIPMFFWVSAAAVGLITLRRGIQDGGAVCLWAIAPAAIVAWYGEIMPIVAIPGVMALAWLMRTVARWSWVLSAAAVLGLAFSAALISVGDSYLEFVTQTFAQVFEGLDEQAASQALLQPPTAIEIAGMFGLVQTVTLIVCVLIARWWQAMLYNEGGFRTEFHAIRMSPMQALGMIAAAAALGALGPEFKLWSWMPLVPLLFAGLGLVHGIVAASGRRGWLGLFYAAMLILPPVKQLLVVLAVTDSWMDFRLRLRRASAENKGSDDSGDGSNGPQQ